MHWIQAKQSHEPDQPVISVKVVAVQEDGRIDVEGDAVELTLWHHDPRRLRSVEGNRAKWRPRFHVLCAAGLSFNLAGLDRVVPCVPPIRRRPTETVRQYIERAMRENHGYTVPQRLLADLDASSTATPANRGPAIWLAPTIRPGRKRRCCASLPTNSD